MLREHHHPHDDPHHDQHKTASSQKLYFSLPAKAPKNLTLCMRIRHNNIHTPFLHVSGEEEKTASTTPLLLV